MNTESDQDDDEHDDNAPTKEELAEMKQASPRDAEAVDALLLSHCTAPWQKVAAVIGASLDGFEAAAPHLPFVYLPIRLLALVERGLLQAQGDVMSVRTSEVRLPPGAPPA